MERLLGKCCIAIAIGIRGVYYFVYLFAQLVLLVGISIAHFSIIIPLVSSSLTTVAECIYFSCPYAHRPFFMHSWDWC